MENASVIFRFWERFHIEIIAGDTMNPEKPHKYAAWFRLADPVMLSSNCTTSGNYRPGYRRIINETPVPQTD